MSPDVHRFHNTHLRCILRWLSAVTLSSVISLGTAYAVEPGFRIEVGAELLDLPGVRFGLIHNNYNGGGGHIATIENDDGRFSGGRIDLSLGSPRLSLGDQHFTLGMKGFHSRQDADSTGQTCQTSTLPLVPQPAVPFCTVMPLMDPNRSGGFSGAFNAVFDTPGETIAFLTRREAKHRGISLEIEVPLTPPSSTGTVPTFAIRLGPAVRQLGHDLAISAQGTSLLGTSTGAVSYAETLSTRYWGGYFGVTGRLNLSTSLSVVLDGEVGIYRARTEFAGSYAASGATGSGNPAANLRQTLSLQQSDGAVISAVKIAVENDFGLLRLGGFVRGEYYSHAPAVAYNNNDLTGGIGQNLVGPNDGTRLRSSDARSVSVGLRVVVPFSRP